MNRRAHAFPAFVLPLVLIGGGAFALPPEGQYAPRSGGVGDAAKAMCPDQPRWELSLVEGTLNWIWEEASCTFTNPVDVRDMRAVLYDAECVDQGENFTFRMMVLTLDDGILIVGDRLVRDLVFCFPLDEG